MFYSTDFQPFDNTNGIFQILQRKPLNMLKKCNERFDIGADNGE